MLYTEEEVLDYVIEEDVKFVRLAYFDLSGKQKNATIMASERPRAFENGIAFESTDNFNQSLSEIIGNVVASL